MEKMKPIDKRVYLINELLQGIEFANELRNQFMNPTNNACSLSSSLNNDNQAPNFLLLEKLLSTFDKTITMAKLIQVQVNQDPSTNHDKNNYGQLESPHSLTMSSPKSENSHPTFKRRKSMMPKLSKKVRIGNEGGVSSGIEGTLDDGFSWRKYGQKDILGAQFPRAYYRCTYRHSRNCAALKQVQRSDEDSTIYQIMYIGDHTCTQGAQFKKPRLNPNIPAQINSEQQPQPPPSPKQELYVGQSPQDGLKIEPEQELDNQAHMFRCFSFTQAHQELAPIDDNYMLDLSPAFESPNTVDHVGLMVQTPETDVNESVSGPNSVTNSPAMGATDVEFTLDELLDFDGNFYLDFK